MSSILGMMFSLSAVTIPVLLETNSDPSHLLSQWARLFYYGHNIMPTTAVAATSLYAYTALRKYAVGRPQWFRYATAGAATISIVPFTLLVMVPTNDALFALHAAPNMAVLSEVKHLLTKWAWMHVARSVFPLVGAISGLFTVLGEK